MVARPPRKSVGCGTMERLCPRSCCSGRPTRRMGPKPWWRAGSRPRATTWPRTISTWDEVGGVGLAIPGPYQRYGVFGKSPNLPETFAGFDVHTAYANALAERAGRAVPLIVGNDGNMGGVAEAQRVRGATPWHGADARARVGPRLRVRGRARPAARWRHARRGWKPRTCPRRCTCSTRSRIPAAAAGPGGASRSTRRSRDFPICWPRSWPPTRTIRSRRRAGMRSSACSSLRGLAQKNDPLALEIFDFQARALGLHVASLAMALDPQFVVIGGGLMDPEATTEAFRNRYLRIIRETAAPYLWPRAARSHQRHARGARRPVAGHRRGPRRAVSGSRATARRRRDAVCGQRSETKATDFETKQRSQRSSTEEEYAM